MKLTENEKRDAIKLIETGKLKEHWTGDFIFENEFLQPWPKFLLYFGKNME